MSEQGGQGAAGAGTGQTQGGGGAQGVAGAQGGEAMVPSSRLREVTAERDKHRQELETARGELETIKKGGATELAKAKDELDGWKKKEAAWLEERALVAHGLTDPEAQVVARTLFNQLDPKDRPADVGAWVAGHKADPTKAPRSLTPWLSPSGAGASGDGQTKAAERAAPAGGQRPDAGGGSAGAGSLTDAAIDAVIDRCKRSNDWAEYDKIRDQVLARTVPGRR